VRSLLFVPGDSERKQARALGSDADALILDLEDSVAPEQREAARRRVHDLLASKRSKPLWVRINGSDSGAVADDLAAVLPARPDGIVLPKVSGVQEIADVAAQLSLSTGLIAIVTETPRALLSFGEYAHGLDARVAALTWGMEDLAAALGASAQRNEDGSLTAAFQLARSLYTDFRDTAGLKREAERARRDGFSGKLAIHPDQVAAINAAFTPSAAEIERAQRIVAAFAAAPGAGVTSLDGKMIDRPHLIQAQRVLASAKS
jgi:citrate lyase subunit beta / citryl-CoA lyase